MLRLPVDQVSGEAEAGVTLVDAGVEGDTTQAADYDLPAFLTVDEEAEGTATNSIDGEHLEAAE